MTTAQTSCPHCQGAISFDTTLAGQTLQCPHCRMQFVVPQAMPPIANPPSNPNPVIVDSGTPIASRGRQSRKQTSPATIVLAVVGTMILGITMVCCGCPLMLGSSGPTVAPTPETDWRTIDASESAKREAWKLIESREERESSLPSVQLMLDADFETFYAESLGSQRYRVEGKYHQYIGVGVRGAIGDDNYRSNWEYRSFDAVAKQTAKGQWELESFDSELEVKVK